MLLNRLRRQSSLAVEPSHAVYYTRGDNLLSPGEYRRSFESDLQRAMSGSVSVSDDTAANAYGISATANACTEKRATMTAGIPAKVVDAQGDDLEDTELSYFVSNAAYTFAMCARSALIYGRVYLRKRYNGEGYPTGLEYIDPMRVREMPDQDGTLSAYGIRQIAYWGMGAEEEVPAKEVIYFQMFDPDPSGNGLSKFEAAFRSLSVEGGIATHAAAFFLNRAAIDGMLTFDRALTDAERKQAEETWRQFKGAKNAHRTAVMPGGATWTAITAPPKDLAMGELDDKQVKKICAVFEVDPTLIGLEATSDPLGASSTFEAVEIAHIRNVAIPFLTMYVLPALNDQWARTDFSQPLTLAIDEANIAAYADANLLKADTAVSLSDAVILDYNESRELLGQPERADYIKRNPKDASILWADGAIEMNEYRWLMGLPKVAGGDVRIISGQLVPTSRLIEVANKMADSIGQAQSPFGSFSSGYTEPVSISKPDVPTPPELPAPVASEPVRAVSEGYAILSLANDGQIKQLQDEIKSQLSSSNGIEWTPPEEFHITLVYADPIDDRQLQRVIGAIENNPPSQMKLDVVALSSFDGDGTVKPLILEIKLSDELKALQTELAVRVKATGAKLSEYSEPNAYKPHITLAYVPSDMSNPELPSEIIVTPSEVIFSRDDYKPIETIELVPSIPVAASRSAQPLELALTFAGNAFIRYCRRALSEALTAQGVDAQWVSEDDWRLTLARADQWTPAAASNIIKASNYADTRPLDFTTDGFRMDGNTVYLTITGDLTGLQRSAGLDFEGANLKPLDADFSGVELCRLDGAPDLPKAEVYPLVGATVALLKGSDPLHSWTLSGVSAARSKELANWRSVAAKGKDFAPDVLRGSDVAAFIADTLEAGVDVDDVFEMARDMERGLLTWRAYPETRDMFVSEVTTILFAGQSNDLDRRNFSARMRTLIRKAGLQAFRDGFNAGGVDPESFDADQLAAFRRWQDETSGYITHLGAEMFKGEGLTEAQIEPRASLWANKSLTSVYYLGLNFAAADKPFTWKLGGTKDHCATCLSNHGQTKTMKQWMEAGLPQSHALDCGGWNCLCKLEPGE